MAATRLLERLTASDLFLLLWDDYDWSTGIGGLAILDGTSPLDDDDGRVRAGLDDLARPTSAPASTTTPGRRLRPPLEQDLTDKEGRRWGSLRPGGAASTTRSMARVCRSF